MKRCKGGMPQNRFFVLDLDEWNETTKIEQSGGIFGRGKGPPDTPHWFWLERVGADCCGCCGCLQRCFRCGRRGRTGSCVVLVSFALVLVCMILIVLLVWSLSGFQEDAGSGEFGST